MHVSYIYSIQGDQKITGHNLKSGRRKLIKCFSSKNVCPKIARISAGGEQNCERYKPGEGVEGIRLHINTIKLRFFV